MNAEMNRRWLEDPRAVGKRAFRRWRRRRMSGVWYGGGHR